MKSTIKTLALPLLSLLPDWSWCFSRGPAKGGGSLLGTVGDKPSCQWRHLLTRVDKDYLFKQPQVAVFTGNGNGGWTAKPRLMKASSVFSCPRGLHTAFRPGKVAGSARPGFRSVSRTPRPTHGLQPELRSLQRSSCTATALLGLCPHTIYFPPLGLPHCCHVKCPPLPACCRASVSLSHPNPQQQALPHSTIFLLSTFFPLSWPSATCFFNLCDHTPAQGLVHDKHPVNTCSINQSVYAPSFLYQYSMLNTSFWNPLLASIFFF